MIDPDPTAPKKDEDEKEPDDTDEFLGPPIAEEGLSEPDIGINNRTCLDCKKEFPDVKSMKLHHFSVHEIPNQPKDRMCPKCDAGPMSKANLGRHLKMKHREKDIDTENDSTPGTEQQSVPEASTPIEEPCDEGVEFKGKNAVEHRRMDALHKGLSVFPWKKGTKDYIIKMWETIPAMREDEREFYNLLNEIAEIEAPQARRLVDMVFGVPDATSQEPYYPTHRPSYEAPSYYGGRRGGGASDSEYEPRGRPPPRAYDDRYPPSRPEYNERPRYAPPVEDPRAIEERIRMEYDLKNKEVEMEAMRKEMAQMKEMLERGPPSAPPTHDRSEDDDMKAMKKQLAETQKALDRAETDRELQQIRREHDAKLARIENEMESSRRYYDEKIQHTSENVSRNPGLSDNAQVALKELETKMTIMQKGMSDFTDLAKTVITAGRPIQAPARSPSNSERDRLRKELGEDAE